jgi:hypothetical protein
MEGAVPRLCGGAAEDASGHGGLDEESLGQVELQNRPLTRHERKFKASASDGATCPRGMNRIGTTPSGSRTEEAISYRDRKRSQPGTGTEEQWGLLLLRKAEACFVQWMKRTRGGLLHHLLRKVNEGLHAKGNSKSHGARPVY